jgi:Fe-S-cluster containining protein
MTPDIFVPFLDGLVDYDCRLCGARCCQTGGGLLVATPEESRVLKEKFPGLGLFFLKTHEAENGPMDIYRKYAPCWFLDGDGLCRIEKEHGLSAKPFACRHHPFYVMRGGGAYVVAGKGCAPGGLEGGLAVVRPARKRRLSREALLADAREAIQRDYLIGDLPWNPERLAAEKIILAGSAAFLDDADYLGFAAFQAAPGRDEETAAAIGRELGQKRRLWLEYLGMEELGFEDRALTRDLAALTSLLRVISPELRSLDLPEAAQALLVLQIHLRAMAGTPPARRTLKTMELVLRDVPLGLIFLTPDHLKLRSRPLEKRVAHLRALWLLSRRRAEERAGA